MLYIVVMFLSCAVCLAGAINHGMRERVTESIISFLVFFYLLGVTFFLWHQEKLIKKFKKYKDDMLRSLEERSENAKD